jgi:protein SCO1/2
MGKAISIAQKILWGLAAIAFVVFAVGVIRNWQKGGSHEKILEGLKVYGTVPDFSLIKRSGRKVGLADLKGKVWVAQFFYTGCRDICLLIVPHMGLLHIEYNTDPEFRAEIRFVSITVDPEKDTPQVLAKFAARFSTDPELWLFLTGDRPAIYRLVQEGFRLGMGEQENSPEVKEKTGEEKEIFNSSRLVLVDRKAQIRDYYSGIDAEAMVRLRRDLKKLLRENV